MGLIKVMMFELEVLRKGALAAIGFLAGFDRAPVSSLNLIGCSPMSLLLLFNEGTLSSFFLSKAYSKPRV
jgi:hypothetical protein